ncbi:MAG: quinol monooxygenase YgiN [Halocynthiibacter sp.]|jgi:quinol monooxygenase YgiN
MFIAHVTFPVSRENRAFALEALLKEVDFVRALPGCIAFIPFLDPTDPQGLGVLHEWTSAEEMGAYLASDCFASIGEILRPIMAAPPISKRFDAQLIETVN